MTSNNYSNEIREARIEEREKFKKLIQKAIHDINTPLTSLALIVDTIQTSNNDPESKEFCAATVRSAANKIGLITDKLIEQVSNG